MKNTIDEIAGFFEEVLSVLIYSCIIFAAVFFITR